jgi:type IV pilus assembly protein PilC
MIYCDLQYMFQYWWAFFCSGGGDPVHHAGSQVQARRIGWDLYILVANIGNLIEKNILARTTRTLGTLVSSGVPILEGLTITRETSGNAVFETIFQRVTEAIREGETIAKPMRVHSRPPFHPVAAFFWAATPAVPLATVMFLPGPNMLTWGLYLAGGGGLLGVLFTTRFNTRG